MITKRVLCYTATALWHRRAIHALLGLTLAAGVATSCTRDVEPPTTAEAPAAIGDSTTGDSTTTDSEKPSESAEKPAELAEKPAAKPMVKPAVATKITWAKSFEEAVATAKAENRPIMIDFWAEWCGPCKMLDEQVYTDKKIIAAAQDFVNVKVNVDERRDVAEQFAVASLPTVMWFDPTGSKVLDKVEGVPMNDPIPFFIEHMATAQNRFSRAVKL